MTMNVSETSFQCVIKCIDRLYIHFLNGERMCACVAESSATFCESEKTDGKKTTNFSDEKFKTALNKFGDVK